MAWESTHNFEKIKNKEHPLGIRDIALFIGAFALGWITYNLFLKRK